MLGLLLSVSSCAQQPRVEYDRTPSRQEIAAARQIANDLWAGHPTYSDQALTAYAQGVLNRLASARGIAPNALEVEVFDTPFVNASVNAKGEVKLSRTLFTILNDESELAAVLAHELAHHELRHSKTPLNIRPLPGQDDASLRAQAFAKMRKRETEADALSLDILGSAGYDQRAAARAVAQLAASRTTETSEDDYTTTHPSDKKRLAALSAVVKGGGEQRADRYLDAIDGLRVGGLNQTTTTLNGSELLIPSAGLAFTPPKGFDLTDYSDGFVLENDEIGMVVMMSISAASPLEPAAELRHLLFRRFPAAYDLGDTTRFKSMNGRDAVTAVAKIAREGRTDRLRITVVDDVRRRFHIITLSRGRDLAQATELLNAMDASTRPLTPAERQAINGRRLRIVKVRQGDTVASLAKSMGADGERLFRVLNGLKDGEQPKPGARVKVVVSG